MSRIGTLDIGVGATVIAPNTDTRSLIKNKVKADPIPTTNQAWWDTFLSETQAVTPVIWGDPVDQWPPRYTVSGGALSAVSNCSIVRGYRSFTTTGIGTGLKYFIKLDRWERYLYSDNGNLYTFEDASINYIIVAKGTWPAAIATTSDWNAYQTSDQLSIKLSDVQYITQQKATEGTPTFTSETFGTAQDRYIEIPETWINFAGKTKIAILMDLSTNIFRLTDFVPSGSTANTLSGGFGGEANIKHLAVGAKI